MHVINLSDSLCIKDGILQRYCVLPSRSTMHAKIRSRKDGKNEKNS